MEIKTSIGKILELDASGAESRGTERVPGALANLVNLRGANVPTRVTYRVAKLMQALQPEFQAIHKSREAILNKNGVLDIKTGKWVFTPPEAEAEANKEFGELMATEVTLAVAPVEIPGDVTGLSARDLIALEGFVVVKE